MKKAVRQASCFGVTEVDLVDAVSHGDINRFQEILNEDNDIDLERTHEEGPCSNKTLIEWICEKRLSNFAKVLLKYIGGADTSKLIHIAAQNTDSVLLKVLLDEGADANSRDWGGKTVVHIAAANNDVNSLNVIFQSQNSKNILVDPQDENGRTPVFTAAAKANKEAVIFLAEKGANLMLLSDADDMNTLEMVEDTLPELYDQLNEKYGSATDSHVNADADLWWALKEGDMKRFELALKSNPDVNVFHTDKACIHYACENNLFDFVELLLKHKADVNLKDKTDYRTGAHHAAAYGYSEILQLLGHYGADLNLQTKSGYTPLHFVTKKDKLFVNENSNYEKCLEFLLNNDRINVNLVDNIGNNPLHFAANERIEGPVLRLLKQGADFTRENEWGDRPLDRISSETMNTFFNSCIELLEENTRDSCINFNYGPLLLSRDFSELHEENSSYLKIDDLKPAKRAETRVLRHLVKKKEHWALLRHPLIKSFLHLKWQKCWKYYLSNTIIYVIFVALLTFYCVEKYSLDNLNQSKLDTTTSKTTSSETHLSFIRVVLFLVNIFLTIREGFQFFIAPVRYVFMVENLAEWAMIISLYIALIPTSLSLSTETSYAAVALFLAWVELVLLFGRYRRFSVSVSIFLEVSKNFVKLMAWYLVFILGFIFTFYVLFQPEGGFSSLGASVLKVMVMMTGEFDYGGIPITDHPVLGACMFLLFLFFVTIVLMNLLTGLAVEDTRLIRNNAEIIYQKSLLDLISYIEAMFFGDYEFLREYPKLVWVRHCFPCQTVLECSLINQAVHFLGKHTLLFYSLPNTNVTVKLNDAPHVVTMKNETQLTLTKDIVDDARNILEVTKEDSLIIDAVNKIQVNVNKVNNKIGLIDNKLDNLDKTINFVLNHINKANLTNI